MLQSSNFRHGERVPENPLSGGKRRFSSVTGKPVATSECAVLCLLMKSTFRFMNYESSLASWGLGNQHHFPGYQTPLPDPSPLGSRHTLRLTKPLVAPGTFAQDNLGSDDGCMWPPGLPCTGALSTLWAVTQGAHPGRGTGRL